MKEVRKTLRAMLSVLLCTAMIVTNLTLIPVQAAEEIIYVLAGGDFQEAGDHANSAANVTNILAQVSQKYDTMDGFLFIGDYDCETHDSATETANGITALMGAVQSKYSNLNDANSVLVQGNHDYMDSRIDATGGHDFNGYSAYVLNEDDYPNGGGSQAGIQALANNLKTWLNDKAGEGYDAPIFIVSHLPLAFTPRTVTQGDAKYAKYIFDVLNDAGKNGLNIIFLHGHDHAYGPDNYMGGEAIYLPVGDKICIAEAGSTSAWTEETLNFTYMNAGYTGYYSDAFTYVTTAGTDKLTMTVFAITDNQVTVERYSANGLYNLKSAGYDGSYSNTSVTNVSLGLPKYSKVYVSPQTIELTEAEDYGSIGSWVGIKAEDPADDVTTSNKGWVELIAPVPETPAVPGTLESTKYVYTLDTDGSVTDKSNAEQGYLIVGSSNASAMTDSLGATGVTITDNAITLDAQPNYEWWITADGKITDGTNWLAASIDRRSGSVSVTTNESDAYSWSISHTGNGSYQITGKYSGMWSQTTYYLRYSNNAFSITNSSNTVRLFNGAEVYTPATEGTPAVPGTNGTYGKISGDLTYNATVGMTTNQAMALVKAGIDGYYYEAMSTPGSDVTGTKVDDSVLTWEWVDTFDGNTAGDYEVAIKYDDFLLGTAEVIVPATTTYYVAEGNGLYLVDMNTTEANAMAAVKAGVTVYSATDANGSNKTAISDNDVTWNWVDKYNGADSGPYTVEILKDGKSLGTVEVKVNIQYETGINSDWTYIGESEPTGGSYTYTLDTDGIDYGEENKYIIVDDNENIVLNANSSSNGTAHSITISGNTATLNTRDYEYHMIRSTYNGTRYELITKGDGSQYLYQESNGVRYGTRSSVKFQVNHHGSGVYDIHDIDGTNWYIIYNGGWTVTETTSARVRLYKYTGTTGGTPGGPIYALIEGNTVYTVAQGSSATKALAAVKAGITGYTATDANGTGKTELKDSDLTWKWKNTFNGNSIGSYWVEISYQGKILGNVEVKVEPGVVNNYPEYPDEGAVKVNKTATGIDFQSSGIAQIELSASGVPIKKGVDVIVMLDTSSSMTSHNVTGTSKTRAQVLEESLAELITQFKTPDDSGQLLDIRVAIADFNGFYGENHNANGTPYDRDAADMMSDDISYNANSEAQVYTGDGTLGVGAFIPVEDLAASYTLNYTSGTNYDYAMDAIYQMGTAIKEANTEDRDLYVIFMSDGAAMQWNYYHSQGASSLWNNWITGAWTANQLSLNCNTHAYYYDEVDHNGDGMRNEHRMANAIKGDPTEQFEVIRKVNTLGTPTGETNMYMVPGLGAKMFSISFDAQADTNVTEESMDKSIESLATPKTENTQYYYKVTSAEELSAAFNVIGTEIAYAATDARFIDTMGENYNIQLAKSPYTVVDDKGTEDTEDDEEIAKSITPTIEVKSYEIYNRADYENGICELTQIGDRKTTDNGNYIYTTIEKITFNDDGTAAYSNGGTTNIIKDNVICANTFWYNLSADTKTITLANGKVVELPAETFYWNIGTIGTSEIALSYYVYLDDSMEGDKPAGSYATNESAILYYTNYLGKKDCKKATTSPVLAWKSANVSYAFYLVDDAGNVVVNQNTGQTGSFNNKVAVTNPTVYREILLNNTDQVNSIEIASLGVLPFGYELYDEAAEYEITINSNSTGSWEIKKGTNKATTYVTQFSTGTQYSNSLTEETVGYDYTHTVVWFAVKYAIKAVDDAVVVDYGIPVNITVMNNDMFGDYGKLAAVGRFADKPTEITTNLDSNFSVTDEIETTYGKAKANAKENTVTYTLYSTEMNSTDKFAYAVNYKYPSNPGYYYGSVTVIPATTIYYEDNFVTYKSYQYENNGIDFKEIESLWSQEGTTINATQDEDRPGEFDYNFDFVDANNVYGYDSAYKEMSQYSLGSAKKITVDPNTFGEVSFSYWGTGFDVISLTSNTTGAISVKVIDEINDTSDFYMVDTYYGYEFDEKTQSWQVKEDASDTLYQIPVIKVINNQYSHYTVTITAAFNGFFDHNQYEENKYDFYFDAVRIYNPAGNDVNNIDTTIKDAYIADGELAPEYTELRNILLTTKEFGEIKNDEETIDGAVYIDGAPSVNDVNISDYEKYGPNNEVYLSSGQAIAFEINNACSKAENVKSIQIAVKTLGNTGSSGKGFIKIYDAKNNADDITAQEISTATDMYYDITELKGKTVVITNSGTANDSIVSITNIKVTYKPESLSPIMALSLDEETSSTPFGLFTITRSSANLALTSLVVPETFEPETFEVEVNETVKVGKKATVTVTTSDDVESIIINDVTYTSYKTDKTTGNRIWTVKLETETEGDMMIEVFASNADDILSDPITKSITVTAKKEENNIPSQSKPSKPSSTNRNEINLYPQYHGLKDLITDEIKDEDTNGIAFIDENGEVSIYKNEESNKEIHLTADQAIIFNLDVDNLALKDILLGIKALEETGKVEIYTVTTNNEGEVIVENEKTLLLNKTSDLYQEITDFNHKTIVIKNTGIDPVSITNLKVTYIKATDEEVITINRETLESALETLGKETELFEPETIEVEINKTKVKVGKKVTVTVTTSDDVECITVNGETCTTYKTDKKTGLRTWKVKVEAEAVGEMMIDVKAYDVNLTESEAITNTITVAPRKTITIFGNMIEDLLDMFFGMFR